MRHVVKIIAATGSGVAAGGAGGAPAATLSVFSMSDVDDIWATINVTTDTGSGTIYYVVVPTAAAAPSAVQIIAGTDGSGAAATKAGNFAVSSAGAKTHLAYGLGVATVYDCYVVQQTSAASNVVTAEFTTATTTHIVRHAEDGATTDLSAGTGAANITGNVADSLGGTNAISFSDNGDLASGAVTLQVATLTYNNGVNRVRFRAKVVSSSVADMWMRVNPFSTTVVSTTHLNLTDRNNTAATQNWATATVTDLDGSWLQFDGTIDMTGADVTGILRFTLGDADNDITILRNGTQVAAMHDIIVSHT